MFSEFDNLILAIIKNPEKFNKYLNDNFKYGYIYKGKRYYDDFRYYKTISPPTFMKQKIGVCWDYVALEDYFFNNFLNLEYKLFYIEADNDNRSTHTWLSYVENDVLKSFESAWYDFRGIKQHKDQDSMLKYYSDIHKKFTGSKVKLIFQFEQPKIFNLDCIDYMNYIYQHGIKIKY